MVLGKQRTRSARRRHEEPHADAGSGAALPLIRVANARAAAFPVRRVRSHSRSAPCRDSIWRMAGNKDRTLQSFAHQDNDSPAL